LVFTRRGIDIDSYPAIKTHLSRFRSRLEPRPRDWDSVTVGEWQGRKPGNYKWYEIQDDIAYWKEFEVPRIVYQRFQVQALFVKVEAGKHVNDAIYMLGTAEDYLLGVLNSKPFWSEIVRLCPRIQNGHQLLWDQFKMALIPKASAKQKEPIEKLVGQILSQKNQDSDADVSDMETEIDNLVDYLYFHADEAPTYDEWLAMKEAEHGTAVEEIRNLIRDGESRTVEFKQSLEYVVPDSPEMLKIPEAQRKTRLGELQKAVTHSALKTICAFLNSGGGTLVMGVHDGGEIIGIEPDYTLCKKQNRDGFELKLTDLLKTRLKPLPLGVDIRFVEVDGKTVCRVQAPASVTPHYLDNKLYVRFGNSTEELTGRDLEDWLKGR